MKQAQREYQQKLKSIQQQTLEKITAKLQFV